VISISCIIPVRNRKGLVLSAIESAIRQDVPELEIVVVDDGSTDGTPSEIHRHFPEITLLRKRQGSGPGDARNIGVMASQGRILMFLDSDDIWLENHCSLLMERLESGFQAAFGVTENEDTIKGTKFLIPEHGATRPCCMFSALLRWCFMVPSSFAVTREAFMTVGGFTLFSPGEDWLFFLELARRFPFGFVQQTITWRRLHPDSLCLKAFDKSKATAIMLRLKEATPGIGCRDNHILRMEKILDLITKDGDKWQSVQDWYTTLKRHNLI